MRVIQHPSNTRVIGAPAKWDQRVLPVGAAPVTDSVQDGTPTVTLYFEPTDYERELIAAGKQVAVTFLGSTVIPVSVSVEVK